MALSYWPTDETRRINICVRFHIHPSQSHLINLSKAQMYIQYCKSPLYNLECFLDMLERERQKLEENEE